MILAGVKAVVLHDNSCVELRGLGAQFYLTEAEVGVNRAAACEAKLQELNSAVAVSSSQDELTESFVAPFDVCPPTAPVLCSPQTLTGLILMAAVLVQRVPGQTAMT